MEPAAAFEGQSEVKPFDAVPTYASRAGQVGWVNAIQTELWGQRGCGDTIDHGCQR